MQQPPVLPGTTRHRKWAQRATPPLLCHRGEESLLTYTAASPPRTHGVPRRGCLVIKDVLKKRGQTLKVGQPYDKDPKSHRNVGAQTLFGGSRWHLK
ncbi:hypothetical protein AVEN_248324-1 [Araneus ventricosus]|uniref:Uncharacterized protein n=1 Tax=Araneus ventricosus TaxID=182803 RepID=A0A4Y2QTM1_ARAVE|nr:hypothetical protein AVEN_248324-1 [Araneus ventricosus]